MKRFRFVGIEIVADPNMKEGEARMVSMTWDEAGQRMQVKDEVRIVNLDRPKRAAKSPVR